MNASRLLHIVLLVTATVAWLGCGSTERTPVELAEFYFSRPDYPKALEACQAALDQATTNVEKADILVIRGRCFVGQGHDANGRNDSQQAAKFFEEAIASFTAALELQSGHLGALHNRRMAYRLMGQEELASEDYALIRKLDPDYQIAYQREPDDEVRLKHRKVDTDFNETEETDSEGQLVDDQPVIELDDDNQQQRGAPTDKQVADNGTNPKSETTPAPQISVSDFEPSVPDPSSQLSQWLSQHRMDPSLGRQPATMPPATLDRSLAGLNPNSDVEDEESESDPNATPPEGNAERNPTGLTSPSNWPSSSQWPQFPTQPSPSLPTGIVGPSLHPPTAETQPVLPYRGMVAPTGATGVGAAPFPNRSAPYANQTPTTGLTGAFSPYQTRGASLGPYRQTIPEGFRTQASQPDASSTSPRIPQSLRPQAPKRPTAPRTRLQYQTSPLSSPSIRPGN